MTQVSKPDLPRRRAESNIEQWEPERLALGIRHMMCLHMGRRAKLNVHRRTCGRCQVFDPVTDDLPACTKGRVALLLVRQSREAISILTRRLEAAASPPPEPETEAGALW